MKSILSLELPRRWRVPVGGLALLNSTIWRALTKSWLTVLLFVPLLIASCGSADADAITPSSSEVETLLTVEDAQERLAFNLFLPATVTEGLDLAGVIVGDNP